MLVLSRKERQRIMIGDDVIIQVLDVKRSVVRLGVNAPVNVRVDREEVAVKKAGSVGTVEQK